MKDMIKMIGDAKPTLAYITKLDREKYLALAVVICITLAGLFGLHFHVAEEISPNLISTIMFPLSSLIGVYWALTTAYRTHRGPVQLGVKHALAWLLIGIGLLLNFFNELYSGYLLYRGQTIPVPSFLDVGFTFFYLFAFVGLFLMPTVLQFRLRMIFDGLLTTLCILGIIWFFFIDKILFIAQREAGVSTVELATLIAYPCWDMLLMLAIVLLIYRRGTSPFVPFFCLLGVGLFSDIGFDVSYAYTTVTNTYHTWRSLLEPFHSLVFLLVGLSGIYQYAAITRHVYHGGNASISLTDQLLSGRHSRSNEYASRWQLIQNALVYLPLAILLILMLYSEYMELVYNQHSSFLLAVVTAIVGILVAIRSLIATRDNGKLLRALAGAAAKQEAIAAEQTQLYKKLRTTHERLQELDKLKDQFMITASHELRTPLTSIQGYLELLVVFGDTMPPEQQKDFLLKAYRGSEELVLLLNNVMDASRLEVDAGIRPAHLQAVDVCEVVHSVVELIEPQLTHDQRKVEISIPSTLAVQAEPVRLRQVLLNLSMNALKYSPPGSPITFSALSTSYSPPNVILSVIDKGNGIAPQDQERLFQRFVRLERDLNSVTRGSGLGLYISRQLVEAMEGKIWVESSGIPGEGSSFNIQLLMSRNS
jgi:signal transduction histidine kinase